MPLSVALTQRSWGALPKASACSSVRLMPQAWVTAVAVADLKVACDDEWERARARVCADGGERGKIVFAKAAACD